MPLPSGVLDQSPANEIPRVPEPGTWTLEPSFAKGRADPEWER